MRGCRRIAWPSRSCAARCWPTVASNLGAVCEFAACSVRMTDYHAATDHSLDSADRQLVELPDAKRFEARAGTCRR